MGRNVTYWTYTPKESPKKSKRAIKKAAKIEGKYQIDRDWQSPTLQGLELQFAQEIYGLYTGLQYDSEEALERLNQLLEQASMVRKEISQIEENINQMKGFKADLTARPGEKNLSDSTIKKRREMHNRHLIDEMTRQLQSLKTKLSEIIQEAGKIHSKVHEQLTTTTLISEMSRAYYKQLCALLFHYLAKFYKRQEPLPELTVELSSKEPRLMFLNDHKELFDRYAEMVKGGDDV